MNTLDKTYLQLLDDVMTKGRVKKDRTGVGTISMFGYTMRIDLSEGLSLLTTKYVHHPAVLHELLWFLRGGEDIEYLVRNGVKIWDDWPFRRYTQTDLADMPDTDFVSDSSRVRRHFDIDEYRKAVLDVPGFAGRHGRVGKVYGAQWVNWTWPRHMSADRMGIDSIEEIRFASMKGYAPEYHIHGYNQIQKLVETLRTNPDSRRMLVTAWNPPEMDEAALPCCHFAFQCYTREGAPGGKRILDLQIQLRSVDVFLGMPFDIASYSVLVHMLAAQVNMVPGELIVCSGDTHIYLNHVEQVREQLKRRPFDALPKLFLSEGVNSIFEYKYGDFTIDGYKHHPAIKAPIAV